MPDVHCLLLGNLGTRFVNRVTLRITLLFLTWELILNAIAVAVAVFSHLKTNPDANCPVFTLLRFSRSL